jgi:vitamin B12 transporter
MRRSIFLHSICGAAALLAAPAWAQSENHDEIVITATRAEGGALRATLGASVTLLGAEDLRARQTRQVSDILRDVPGLAVNRTGGPGGQTQIRIRGVEANHTLVLIDGMEASHPFYGEFDFAALIADEVARVEVLRGAQSALYGSDAIGGVVHYITASGAEAPGFSGRLEHGSFNAWDASARIADVAGPVDFAVSLGYQQTDGTPTARRIGGVGGERDIGAANAVVSGRFVFTLSDHARIRAIGRFSATEAETNDQDFNFPPGPTYGFAIDSDSFYESASAYGLVSGEFEAMDGRWTHALTLQGVDAGRDNFSFAALSARDEGARVKGSYVTSLQFGEAVAQRLTAALDVERERFRTQGPFLSDEQQARRSIDNTGLVLEYSAIARDRFGFGLAMRRDDNERFDDSDTFRAQASYAFDGGARLHAAAGSGIKAPGVYELWGFDPGSFEGNPDLKPERSQGWEAGYEQTLFAGAARFDLTYFEATLEDEIFTDFVGPSFIAVPGNRDTQSEQSGVEVSAEARLGDNWRIHAAYSHLDAEENGVEEVRRPRSIASLNLSWRAPSDRFGAFLTARYNGDMLDSNFTQSGPPRVTLPAYTLVNAGADMRLSQNLSLYARVENALDEEYEDVFTFRSPGRAGFVGLRANY